MPYILYEKTDKSMQEVYEVCACCTTVTGWFQQKLYLSGNMSYFVEYFIINSQSFICYWCTCKWHSLFCWRSQVAQTCCDYGLNLTPECASSINNCLFDEIILADMHPIITHTLWISLILWYAICKIGKVKTTSMEYENIKYLAQPNSVLRDKIKR